MHGKHEADIRNLLARHFGEEAAELDPVVAFAADQGRAREIHELAHGTGRSTWRRTTARLPASLRLTKAGQGACEQTGKPLDSEEIRRQRTGKRMAHPRPYWPNYTRCSSGLSVMRRLQDCTPVSESSFTLRGMRMYSW
jgi:hypothetical protein